MAALKRSLVREAQAPIAPDPSGPIIRVSMTGLLASAS